MKTLYIYIKYKKKDKREKLQIDENKIKHNYFFFKLLLLLVVLFYYFCFFRKKKTSCLYWIKKKPCF